MFLTALSITLVLPACLVCGYYVFLAIVGLWQRQNGSSVWHEAEHSFAIVIPAHNEEDCLANTIRSCLALDYPGSKLSIVVIADNCSDRTAQIATGLGAQCLARHDSANRGKGAALEWGLPQVLAGGPDAIVVLDADCTIDAHALRAFDAELARGHFILQANDAASNSDASITSYTTAVANLLENDLFYAPKSRLGLSVLLRGTGMVFHRTVLERIPWRAQGRVEDMLYSALLYQNGSRVTFVDSVYVRSPFPESNQQLTAQRTRWIGGTAGFSITNALRLLLQGLLHRRWILVDLAWTVLITMRSLWLAELALALVVSALAALLTLSPLALLMLACAGGAAVCYGCYGVLGCILLGFSRRRLGFLLSSPLIVVRMLRITLLSLLGASSRTWVRTPRLSR